MLEYLQPISQKTVRINLLRYALNRHASGESFCIKHATINFTGVIWTQEKGAALSVTKLVKFFIGNGAFIRASKGKYLVVDAGPIHADLEKWESYYGFREKIIPAEKLEERRIRRQAYDKARCAHGKAKLASQWVGTLDSVLMNLGR